MVAAVGHSLVGPSAGCAPSVSVGCISKIIHERSKTGSADAATPSVPESAAKSLVMDCWVHSGCSGGALVLLVRVLVFLWCAVDVGVAQHHSLQMHVFAYN